MASFNFTFDPGTSLQQMIGVEVAGRIWSQYLVDNVNINIHVGVSSSLPTSVIGGALPALRSGVSYTNIRNAMGTDRRSTDDFTAFNHLSAATTQTVNFDWMTTGSSAVWQQASTQRSMSQLNLTNANAKALGLATNGANLDGYILLSSNAPWNYDFNRSSVMSSTQLDFLSTAMHEIGHVLGFISGVDDPGWTMDVYDAYYWGQLNSTYTNIINNRTQNSTTLDLFRFNYNKTSYFPDLSYGHEGGWKGLSIDDGQSFIGEFSTGATAVGGNNEQASHWKTGMDAIMAPTLARGQRMNIAQIDLRAMDVMGWDLSTNGINTAFSLATLQSQAKQSLANRLGTTMSWLDNNQATAAYWLGQSRAADIDMMIRNSTIYEWGSDGDGWWQRVVGLFQQRSLFSSLDEPSGVTSRQSLGSGLGQGVDMAANFWVQAEAFPSIASPDLSSQETSPSTNSLDNLTIAFTTTRSNMSEPILPMMTIKLDQFDLTIPKSFHGDSLSPKSPLSSQRLNSWDQPCWGSPGEFWW